MCIRDRENTCPKESDCSEYLLLSHSSGANSLMNTYESLPENIPKKAIFIDPLDFQKYSMSVPSVPEFKINVDDLDNQLRSYFRRDYIGEVTRYFVDKFHYHTKEKENEILSVSDIILSEVNVKCLKVVRDNSNEIFVKKVKPNFKLLGSIHGSNMNMVSKKIFEMSGEGIKDLEVKGSCKFVLENGEKIEILLEQVEISFGEIKGKACLLYTSPSPRDLSTSRMPSSA